MRVLFENPVSSELDYELNSLMRKLPASIGDRLKITTIEGSKRLQAVVSTSEEVDLTIIGASREWGFERSSLGGYGDELSMECRSSLLITRKYSQVTSHLTLQF